MAIEIKSSTDPIEATYENVTAKCEHCGRENIFNRASDLKTLRPISAQPVVCLYADCGKPFYISGDCIGSVYEMYYYDCFRLCKQKRYSLCILSLAQAWEVFFANYFRIELVYKPYGVDDDHDDQDKMNREIKKLYETTEKWTFGWLKNVFLNSKINPGTVQTVDALIAQYRQLIKSPQPMDIDKIDMSIRTWCKTLYKSGIGALRNQVVHKDAYRPTKDEVDKYLQETGTSLLPLGRALRVLGDDVNLYKRTTR